MFAVHPVSIFLILISTPIRIALREGLDRLAANMISLCDNITLCLTNIQTLFYEVNHQLHR